ncbi:phosphoribosyl-ATP diphosphatase [Acidomonas methanolica]|uniref:phosphoribosyl-ATP diphosphatase n=1 Tax=Acidomonas methanolica TaxID=437 RepID=UPI00277B5566|nr:phosphoribosyl-ATP diphosphatase [Acidomonas methanolica]MCQ9154651.1 phosphoribosyl-ATP diphosphatase [Acidomonas methanolica]
MAKATPKSDKKSTGRKSAAPVPPEIDAGVLDTLYQTITARRGTDPALSHSARLLSRGTRKIAQKFGEEAVECLIEAVAGNKRELIGESADVLYHLLVMWVDAGVQPEDVWSELRRREAMSGVAEKASRPKENV